MNWFLTKTCETGESGKHYSEFDGLPGEYRMQSGGICRFSRKDARLIAGRVSEYHAPGRGVLRRIDSFLLAAPGRQS
jgi:hypothetical protein